MVVRRVLGLLVGLSLSPFTFGSGTTGSSKIYETFKLSNGLEVVSLHQDKVPLVTLVLSFRAGSKTETPDVNGLTHVWEHMFFAGNKKLADEAAFQRRQRQLGIVSNAVTSAEYVYYHFKLPSAYLAEGLELIAECIKTPSLATAALNKERVVVLDEYDRSASQPGFKMRSAVRKILYGDQGYRRDPLGKRDIIANVTREQLLRIKFQVFVPQNAGLLVGGDFNSAELRKLVDKYFADWKGPKNWKAPELSPFPPFPSTTSIIEVHPNAQNVQLLFYFKGPRVGVKDEDDDTITADIFSAVLAHQSGSFYQKYVDSGKTLGAGAHYSTQKEVGEILVYASVLPEKVKEVETELLKERSQWAKESYYSDTALADVIRGLRISNQRSLNKVSDFVIGNLTFFWTVTGLEYFDTYLSRLAKVTKKDLAKFAKTYFVDKSYVQSVLLNSEDAKKTGYESNLGKFIPESSTDKVPSK